MPNDSMTYDLMLAAEEYVPDEYDWWTYEQWFYTLGEERAGEEE